ncbi:lipase family protein [Arcanobacterium ihumii]|uniref:lipase family protein n=1 Tax=Arcanobacterium ihumii TaxID=2138162 RepID=UPI001F1D7C82|nr:lipase family protein [Arcanobacterium ihumii]
MFKKSKIALTLALSSTLALGVASTASANAINQPTKFAGTSTLTVREDSAPLPVTSSQGDSYIPFYHDIPDLSQTKPGQLLRSEKVINSLNTLGISNVGPYKASRILYSSINRKGEKIPVSGIVIETKAPWKGAGQRPLVAFAPGTQGVADRCAPSFKIGNGVGDYEQFFFEGLLKEGYAVVVTDYEGLGTPGMHTYMDRISQGHAVLDSARAAKQLNGWDFSATTPIAIDGYSQGGGAAASAAELADDYAPELDIKLASVGAAPADLTLLPPALDGTIYFLFEAYALMGISHSYDVDLAKYLNPEGQQIISRATNNCTLGLGLYSGTKLAKITADGSDVWQFIEREPYKSMLADQHIGYDAPSMPVVVTHSTGDDVIPYRVGEQLVSEWKARGADITFIPNNSGPHVAGAIPHAQVTVTELNKIFKH